jgi:hypothetical protein
MRRTHLRQHTNILKRQLIHVGAFNLSLILRKLIGAGTPREWRNGTRQSLFLLLSLMQGPWEPQPPECRALARPKPTMPSRCPGWIVTCSSRNSRGSATGC